MKAERYIINVCDSTLDYSHGFYRTIVEYYFKDRDLTINKETCFIGQRDMESKKELTEVDIDLDIMVAIFVIRLKQSIIDKEELIEKLSFTLSPEEQSRQDARRVEDQLRQIGENGISWTREITQI